MCRVTIESTATWIQKQPSSGSDILSYCHDWIGFDPQQAEALLEKMKSHRMTPNTYTWNLVLNAWVNQSSSRPQAEAVMQAQSKTTTKEGADEEKAFPKRNE